MTGNLFDRQFMTDLELLGKVDLLHYPHCHVQTSKQAAQEQDPKQTSQQYIAILGALRISKIGCTRHELEIATGILNKIIDARLNTLARNALVWKTCDRREGRSGKDVEVICHVYNQDDHASTKAFERKFVRMAEYTALLVDRDRLYGLVVSLGGTP